MNEYIIEMLDITKTFSSVVANDNVTLKLKKGEIHVLLGANAAGKSTLMSVLSGVYKADKGVIKKDGKEIKITGPYDAAKHGIGMVYQHFRLVEVFTVLDNIILGVEPTKLGFIKRKKAKEKIKKLCEKYKLYVDLDKKVEKISVSMQQKTEILKMLYRNHEIMIFDEPTALLTPQETKDFLSAIKSFAKEGKTVLFITHKLEETMGVADTITVLRKGRKAGTVKKNETNKETLSQMMIGKTVEEKNEKTDFSGDEKVLEVNNLVVSSNSLKGQKAVNNLSFTVKKGEILCIAGIDGNGQHELTEAITGLKRAKNGTVKLNGNDITNKPVSYRNKLGISHIPEDRHKHGLILDFPLKDNMILKKFRDKKFQQNKIINLDETTEYSDFLIKKFGMSPAASSTALTRTLSGGTQQKAVIARELDLDKPLIIAVQPTRGLDIKAANEVHKSLIRMRNEGKSVLLISYETDEMLNISDRILVMYEGRITGELDPKSTSPALLGLYISGAKKDS